ncbi:hypothetical protein J1605_001441 [Eschrichtius robustus]|uniref:Uncharacterized protein n=1 Tax=Eschrichtius robustus TaxID=9764 RepID=A0AB34I317_ESCRO|nr:hypothetical protein J1605_001441 [Eschrichtius robustus]
MSGSVPIHDSGSEYIVPPQLFPGPAYPVYCSGGDFRLSGRTIQALRQAACHTPLFPIDDAYLPGARQPSFDPCMYRELLFVHRFAPYEMLLTWKVQSSSLADSIQQNHVQRPALSGPLLPLHRRTALIPLLETSTNHRCPCLLYQ